MGFRFDCGMPVSAAIRDPPTEVSVAIRKLGGTMFYDHRVFTAFVNAPLQSDFIQISSARLTQ